MLGLAVFMGMDSGLFASSTGYLSSDTIAQVKTTLDSVADEIEVIKDELPAEIAAQAETDITYSQRFAQVLLVLCVVLLWLMIHLRKRIMLAIAILKEASKVVQFMPMLLAVGAAELARRVLPERDL